MGNENMRISDGNVGLILHQADIDGASARITPLNSFLKSEIAEKIYRERTLF
jgi:hypothetical protein